jgi:RND family efflux transporter MFP subunit
MTRRIHVLGLLVLGGLMPLAAAGCNRAAPAADGAANKALEPAATLERVVAGKPSRKTISLSTSQPGQVEAFEETPLFAKLAGFVDKVLVDIGDPVAKGQPLVEIAIPEMQDDLEQKRALVAQAEAEVAQAEVFVEGAKAAVDTAGARVAHAEAGVMRAKGEHERWRAEHSRIKELAADRAVTQKLVDEMLNQLQGSEGAYQETLAAVQSSRALLKEAQVNVRKAEADLGAAAARLRVAKANLAHATTLLGYTAIKAPYDGAVTRRAVATGDYVGPATGGAGPARPILVVCRTDIVRVFVDVPELEAEWVTDGDKAVVRVQALGGKSFDAKVTRNSWSLDPTNRSLRTEIDIPNPAGALRPGMFATATILLEERPNALTLPAAAVVREGSDYFCCVIEGGKVQRREIKIGLRSGADVEVLAGLAPEQTVALAQAASLKPGQPVEVAAPEKK